MGFERTASSPRPWGRLDAWLAGGLAFATLVSRMLNRSRFLNQYDSFLYAHGIRDYDVYVHQPHPPGYPVYVGLAKALHALVGEVNLALVLVSVGASAVAVVCVYGLARERVGPWTAFAAAGLFFLSPVFVYNGVVALSYTAEGAGSVALAWSAWRVRRSGSWKAFLAFGALGALVVGIRPSSLLFLAPLGGWALLGRPLAPRVLAMRLASAVAGGLPVALAWFVPMAQNTTGGYAGYRKATDAQFRHPILDDTVFNHGWTAFEDHGLRLLDFLRFERFLPIAFALILVLALLAARGRVAQALRPTLDLLPFLLAWILPATLFYATIYDGGGRFPPGYALVISPALYVAFAVAGAPLVAVLRGTPTRLPPRATTAAAVLLFLLPAVPLSVAIDPLLRVEVRDRDAWAEGWSALSDSFPPNETVLLAWHSFPHARWYFHEYESYRYWPHSDAPGDFHLVGARDYVEHGWPPGSQGFPLERIKRVVVMDRQLLGEGGSSRLLDENVSEARTVLSNGWDVRFFEPDADHATLESYFVGRRSQ